MGGMKLQNKDAGTKNKKMKKKRKKENEITRGRFAQFVESFWGRWRNGVNHESNPCDKLGKANLQKHECMPTIEASRIMIQDKKISTLWQMQFST